MVIAEKQKNFTLDMVHMGKQLFFPAGTAGSGILIRELQQT